MAHRTRKQAFIPVAAGAILAGGICVGVASIPHPVRNGTRTAATQRIADASVTAHARHHKKAVTYTIRIANIGPDATGRLRLRTTVPAAFTTASASCRRSGRVLECDWPDGLEAGTDLTFTLVTRRRIPLVLPLDAEAVDWSPANNTARL